MLLTKFRLLGRCPPRQRSRRPQRCRRGEPTCALAANRRNARGARLSWASMRVRELALAAVAACWLVAAPPGAAASGTPWRVGAATVDTTPPPFDAAKDIQDFPESGGSVPRPRQIGNGRCTGRLWN